MLYHLDSVTYMYTYIQNVAELHIVAFWHGSCLGTLNSVAFSRVLREYPVGVRVKDVFPKDGFWRIQEGS